MTYTTEIGKYGNSIKGDALQASPSQENSKHQLRIMEHMAKHKHDFEAARLKLRDINAAVIVSDYGKTQAGKDLLLKSSEDSDLLINSLQGKLENPAAKFIKELLTERFGLAHGSMLNPNLTTDEVREQFNKDHRLTGFFHELPGLLLLIKDYNAKELSEDDFRTQFWTTFAHNGPQKGFWNSLATMINKTKDQNGLTLQLGTPFCNEQGELAYPNPNKEALLHTAYDRFDQALEGLPKLAREISPWADIGVVNDNLLGTNSAWTQEQLDELKSIVNKATEANPELGFIGKTIEQVKATIGRFANYVKERVQWTDEAGTQTLSFKHTDGTRETLRKKADNYYEHSISVTQPSNRQEFLDKNASQFLSRVVRNFKEEDRYAQSA